MSENAFIVLNTVGIPVISQEEPVLLYPNPAHDRINLRLSGPAMINYEVRIMDPGGRIIKTFTCTTQETSLNLADILPGAYLVEVHYGDLKIYRKVLVR